MKSSRGKSSAPVRHHGAFWDRGPTSPTLAAKLRVHVLRTKLDQLVAREYDAKLARKRHRKAAMRARFSTTDLAGPPIMLAPRKYPTAPPPPVSPDNDADMDEREDGEVFDDDNDDDTTDRSPVDALRDRIRALDATLARLQHLEMLAISHMVAQAQAEPRPPVPPPEPAHELAPSRPHSEHVAIPLPPVPLAPPARAAAAAAPARKPLSLPPPPSRRPDRVPRSRLPSSSSTTSITALPPSTSSAGEARSSPAPLTTSPAPSPHSEPTLERVLFGGSATPRDSPSAPAPVQSGPPARPAPLRRDPSSSSLPLPARPPAMARDRDRDRDRDRPLPRAPHAGRRGPNAAPGAAAAAAAAWGHLFPGAATGGGGERRGGASARRTDGGA
ncbi:hypothetical protein GGF31_001726 [Allomyces arbusculus]|nr:hypothetical protein GGF31_001726 [Allomyces arbusculus]